VSALGTEEMTDADARPSELDELARILESLLFLTPEPVGAAALAEAADVEVDEVEAALGALRAHYERDGHGLVLRELAGGYALSSHPDAELAARRLFAKPRTPPLTPAQAETLAIIAYLQPVSRPEIARIRGVSAESAATTLLERGMVEEAGRSQFGAVMYRTTDLFLKLFGLDGTGSLPEIEGFDPSPEFEQELRDRLLRAGEVRAGVAGITATGPTAVPDLDATAVPDYEGHHEAADAAAASALAGGGEPVDDDWAGGDSPDDEPDDGEGAPAAG
jgi:segregation and condensation protein B